MKIKEAVIATVRKRPIPRNRRNNILPCAIYLTPGWMGMKVRVVRASLWNVLMKRIDKAETKLRSINKISKG